MKVLVRIENHDHDKKTYYAFISWSAEQAIAVAAYLSIARMCPNSNLVCTFIPSIVSDDDIRNYFCRSETKISDFCTEIAIEQWSSLVECLTALSKIGAKVGDQRFTPAEFQFRVLDLSTFHFEHIEDIRHLGNILPDHSAFR